MGPPVDFSQAKNTLIQAVKQEVEMRLRYSLHEGVFLELEIQEVADRVNSSRAIDVKVSSESPIITSENRSSAIALCDRKEIGRRLLILGAPGAGKTTILLNLAKVFLARSSREKTPVPLLLSLSTWQDEKQSIRDWLVVQLKEKYGVRQDISKYWVNTGAILPCLDGLDEVAPQRQEQCVEAINLFLQEWQNGAIVCSRIEEYDRLQVRLRLNGAIVLQSLNETLIRDYIQQTNNSFLWEQICNDINLRNLAKTPLFLNIMVLACDRLSLQQWQELESSEARLDYLFEAYIAQMLARSSNKGKVQYSDEETKDWLGYLAKQLIRENITEFYIEKMQPSWLETRRQKFIYGFIYGVIHGSGWGLGFSMLHSLINGLLVILAYGLLSGLFCGFLLMLFSRNTIDPIENIQFSVRLLRKKFLNFFILGLLCTLVGQIIAYPLIMERQVGNLYNLLISNLPFGIIVGFIFGIVAGFKNTEIINKTIPNQGIKRSISNSVFVIIIGLLISSIVFIFALSIDVIILARFLMMPILLIVFCGATWVGGLAAIQHFALRFALTQSHKIPWNYARFLNYSVDRLFLQQVGGSYRFLHDLLRQHFARKYGYIKSGNLL